MHFKKGPGSVPAGTLRFLGGLVIATGVASAQTDTINALFDYEEAQGFELMFDGSSAASFRDRFVNYQRNSTTNTTLHASWTLSTELTDPERPGASFGAIVMTNPQIVDMRSKKLYRDFDWRFEYRNSGNQGVFYRFDVSGGYAWETGVEFAIDNNITQSTLKFRTGAAYDLFAPTVQAYHARNTDRWNSLRIVAKGDSVEHWLNGARVAAFRYWSDDFLAAYQNSKWTGYSRYCQTAPGNRTYIPEGFIGLQGDHGGAWQIRRMRILHDSTATMDRVKFGPVDMTTSSVSPATGRVMKAPGVESAPGLLRIKAGEASLQSIELHGLDGRLAHRIHLPEGAREHAIDVSRFQQGVYLVRAVSSAGVHQMRALVH
jgi:hypothetical protein